MPTPAMHLTLADDLLRGDDLPPAARRLLRRQRGPFLLGHTAPDVKTVSGQRREASHFYTVPRTSDVPAHEALFEAHPALLRVDRLPPAQTAFVAGYIAHLLLDELWLDAIFQRYFLQDWGPLRERLFLHNVLRTWADYRDQNRLDNSVARALRAADPQGWLPFVQDRHLKAWRDWLVEQISAEERMQTAEVFARRMDVSAAEIEAVVQSPQQMDARVFAHIPRTALEAFRRAGYRRSVALIGAYFRHDI